MTYTSKDIIKLNDRDSMRERPTMYIGSTENDGVMHVILETISNSIDEFMNGFGDRIIVKLYEDGSFSIEDNARGIPVGKMEGLEMNSLESVFTQLHAGGKFNSKGAAGYNSTGGLNGIGLKAANFLSDWLIARVKVGGKEYQIKFKDGYMDGEIETLREDLSKTDTGTFIHFKVSADVFSECEISSLAVLTMIKDLSFMNKNLEFQLFDERNEKIKDKPIIVKSENGLLDYLSLLNKDKKTISKPLYLNQRIEDINCEVELALQYNDTTNSAIKTFTNNIPNPNEGTHWTGFSTAFTRTLNSYSRKNGLLKEKDDNFSGQDLREGMSLVMNVRMPEPKFDGQIKSQLKDPRGRTVVEKALPDALMKWFNSDKKGIKAIVNKMLTAQKADKAAKKMKDSFVAGVGKGKEAETKRRLALGDKLTECNGKDPKKNEIFIVEGKTNTNCPYSFNL